jgi:DNA-binding transcriptional MerR regulator
VTGESRLADVNNHDVPIDELLTIGRFARLSGLSVGALRHYDALDVLRPAVVDPDTAYRRYRRDQLDGARMVAQLRDLELPLEEIRAAVLADDVAAWRTTLQRHRTRVQARVTRLNWVVPQLGHLIDPSAIPQEQLVSEPRTSSTDLDPQTQRSLAAAWFNRVWQLLEQPDRNQVDDEEMVNAAHGSRLLWTSIGSAKEWAIGDWQLSRVYTVLGRAEPSVHHARRCLELALQVPDETWLTGSAYEALSRAYHVAGDRAAAAEWKAKATAQLDLIEDPDDREVVAADVATLP